MGVIIGTVGHVDHGKTALIKALTNIDTDRLPEEKKREMSIVLGFAFIDLPKSGRIGIIDVPGHEKFLKNMLTGVRGIDVGLLTVAADEGVMPQTKEHFEIMRLSKMKKLVVAVTKIDIADEESIETTILEIKDLLLNTPYVESPILKVSSVTSEGIDELKTTLDETIYELPPKNSSGIPILPVDRSFVMKGVGTVVTGTLINGSVREGDELCIYPKGLFARVREIQVHNEHKNEVTIGHRVALNLAGVKKDDVQKGDIISLKDRLFTTKLIDAKLELEPSILLKRWTRVKAYFCTAEHIGRIRKIYKQGDTSCLQPTDGYCQIVFESPVVTWFGDTFILRNYSPEKLLGGGIVLNPAAKKRVVGVQNFEPLLEIRSLLDIEKIILAELNGRYVRIEDLRKSLITPDNKFDLVLRELVKSGKVRKVSEYLLTPNTFKELEAKITQQLNDLHLQTPLKSAIPKDKILHKINIELELFNSLLRESDKLQIIGDTVKLKGWKPKLTTEQIAELEKIEKAFKSSIETQAVGTPELINLLIEEGKLVKITKGFIVHCDIIENAKQAIKEYIKKNNEISISEIKGLLGTTRKYAVPFAEYLDQIKFTKRVGDKRILYTE